MSDIVNVSVEGGTVKVTAGEPITDIVVNPPTVQAELLAACRQCVERIDRVIGVELPFACTEGKVRKHWSNLRVARHDAMQAIKRAEREVSAPKPETERGNITLQEELHFACRCYEDAIRVFGFATPCTMSAAWDGVLLAQNNGRKAIARGRKEIHGE